MTMGKLAGNYNKLNDSWKVEPDAGCVEAPYKLTRISRLYSKWFFVDALAEKLHELI